MVSSEDLAAAYAKSLENCRSARAAFETAPSDAPLHIALGLQTVKINALRNLMALQIEEERGRLSHDEGDSCLCPGCDGTMEVYREPCYCSATPYPPCGSCESSSLQCADCGWDEESEVQAVHEELPELRSGLEGSW